MAAETKSFSLEKNKLMLLSQKKTAKQSLLMIQKSPVKADYTEISFIPFSHAVIYLRVYAQYVPNRSKPNQIF